MPTNRKRRGSVAINPVPLPERTAKGMVKRVGEKYVLEVEGREMEIPVGPVVPEADIKRFLGKSVTAFFSKTRPQDVVAIGTWPTPEMPRVPMKPVCVLCYIPAPDIIRRISPRVREVFIREMVREKVISPGLGRYLRTK